MRFLLSSELALIFILSLIMPTCSYGDENYSKRDGGYFVDSAKVDSTQSKNVTPIWKPGFMGFFSSSFGFGHHENFTKEKPVGEPIVESFETHLVYYFELGASYKKTYIYGFVSGRGPAGGDRQTDDGYSHRSGLRFGGVAIRKIILPRFSKLNLIPKVGYKMLKESAKIFDPKGIMPTLVDKSYNDKGIFLGLETNLRLGIDTEDYSSLIVEYQYENLDIRVNKFKIAVSGAIFGNKTLTEEKLYVFNLLSGSLGIEYIIWGDGRKDWFFLLGINVEGNVPL